MIKLINNFRIANKIFRRERRKIFLLCFVYLLTCVTAIVVGSLSLGLDDALYIDDTIANRIITFQDEDLNPSVLDCAETFEDKSIVKKEKISLDELVVLHYVKENQQIFPTQLLSDFYLIDANYDSYNMYEERDVGKKPISSFSEKQIVIPILFAEGPINLTFEWKNVEYTVEVNVVENNTSSCLMSYALYEYFCDIITPLELAPAMYNFSFSNARDALEFYSKSIKIDLTLENDIIYQGATVSKYIDTLEQAGFSIGIVTIVVLITLMGCFVNMLIIFFIDRERHIGLLKAQGLSNGRMSLILLQGIIFYIAVCSVASLFIAYFAMPLANKLITSLFLKQFLLETAIELNSIFSTIVPVISFILVVVPCAAFVIKKIKKPAILLMTE